MTGNDGTLEIYHAMESICSERVRMTLAEKGVRDWISHPLRLFKDEHFSPEYLKLNPKAQVPTLVHNGHIVRESSIICDYLDDIFPEPPMKPAAAHARARMQEWIKGSDEALYQSVSSFSFGSVFRERLTAMGEEAREAHFRKQTDVERTHRQRSCVADGPKSPYVLRAVFAWEKTTKELEQTLAAGGPWVMGEQFTLAEIAFAPFLTRVNDLQVLPIFLTDRPHVADWWARIQARPSFKEAEISCGEEDAEAYRVAGEKFAPEVAKLRDWYRSDPYGFAKAYEAGK